jgi:hypothetical protein
MPPEKISAGACSLISAAISTSQAAAEISAAAKLHHAMRRSRARHAAPTPSIGMIGPATTATKITPPASVSVAAKWMARTRISGSPTLSLPGRDAHRNARQPYLPTRKV